MGERAHPLFLAATQICGHVQKVPIHADYISGTQVTRGPNLRLLPKRLSTCNLAIIILLYQTKRIGNY